MDRPVVSVAQKHQIVQISPAAVRPMHHMVCGGPRGGPVAARPAAALVAHIERAAGGAGHHALVRVFQLPGGFRLLVGRDLEERERLNEIVLAAGRWSFMSAGISQKRDSFLSGDAVNDKAVARR